VGCGPGHVTRFVAGRHRDLVGIDLSPRMVAVAGERALELTLTVGAMLQLPAGDRAWSGGVSL
jgi:trans-aconitate methyltransferase